MFFFLKRKYFRRKGNDFETNGWSFGTMLHNVGKSSSFCITNAAKWSRKWIECVISNCFQCVDCQWSSSSSFSVLYVIIRRYNQRGVTWGNYADLLVLWSHFNDFLLHERLVLVTVKENIFSKENDVERIEEKEKKWFSLVNFRIVLIFFFFFSRLFTKSSSTNVTS